MEVLKIEESKQTRIVSELNWLVGYKIEEDIPHGINESYRGIAKFESLQNAEDFIQNCMPKENHSRFFIQDLENNVRYFNFL